MDGPSLQESRCYFAVCQEEQANFILIRAQAAAPGAGVFQGGRGRGRGPPQVQAMGEGGTLPGEKSRSTKTDSKSVCFSCASCASRSKQCQ